MCLALAEDTEGDNLVSAAKERLISNTTPNSPGYYQSLGGDGGGDGGGGTGGGAGGGGAGGGARSSPKRVVSHDPCEPVSSPARPWPPSSACLHLRRVTYIHLYES